MDLICRLECAICFSELHHVYKIDNMPIKLSCIDTPDLTSEQLSFSICKVCNTIQLDKLIPLDVLYSSSHNTVSVGKVWEGYFQLFCKIIETHIINKNIIEIGDPSGRIANASNGFSNWYIVEPNKNETIIFKKNIHFISDFFDENFNINGKIKEKQSIDIIVHSHVFEHMYSPNTFLKKCYEILTASGEMIFGIPNMQHIALNELAPCLGIFFEHTIFLNKENVSYMLIKNGFKIIEILDYENHSIIYHVKKVKKENIIDSKLSNNIHITNYNDLFMNTIYKWKSFIEKCNFYDESYNIFVFGASYNTQYLLELGLNSIKIKGILDNCKEKQGKFLSGYALQIFSPDIMKDLSNCIVIIKNGYYTNEISEQLVSINKNLLIVS
jgi:predicted SAM-dependent methyltransferase